ncbi:hypothetical protein [Salinarimonas soli]|uniref:Uncharacterized protein n=1 Tax=Salinarimonas soli TaxID=1638099 RepID=A0A5B2V8V5_9HYPH|nr:hypothetical protein [Salinarimonas soli]KAA2235421.1 hypothetical protein F0L46_19520 [Salinarimonas soli]
MSSPADNGASYNLFRRRCAPDLYCAVAQAHPVPGFIDGESWEFAGAAQDERDAPDGFQVREARLGTRLNGFYVFLAYRKAMPMRERRAA